jgi:hypothetical protein
MKNLMQETGKRIQKVWAIKIWRVILVLVLVAGLASVAYLPGRQVLADSKSNSADVIFTKWISSPGTVGPPGNGVDTVFNMKGVDSGDSGPGLFTGEVLLYNLTADGALIRADYHIHGLTHSFTARVNVVQTGLIAVITGSVTGGWMIGAEVSGSYQQITSSGILNATAEGGKCYQGTLHIKGH